MNQKTQVKNKVDRKSPKILETILEELRLLRNEVMLLLPQEDLEEYAHPDRVRSSYQKAIREYPPTSLWK